MRKDFVKVFAAYILTIVLCMVPITIVGAEDHIGDVKNSPVTAGSLSNAGNVKISKSVTPLDTLGDYRITFDVQSVAAEQDVDVYAVVVFDTSGSMICDSSKKYYAKDGDAIVPHLFSANEKVKDKYSDYYSGVGNIYCAKISNNGNGSYLDPNENPDDVVLKNKWNSAVNGAKVLSNTLTSSSNLGNNAHLKLVTFAANSSLKTSNWQSSQFDTSLFTAPIGGTNLAAGIETATSELNKLNNDSSIDQDKITKLIIVMSDGEPNSTTDANTAANNAERNGINIYSIGYEVNETAEDFLKNEIATAPANYTSADTNTVVGKLNDLAEELSKIPAGTNASITDGINTMFSYEANHQGFTYLGDQTAKCNIGELDYHNTQSCSFDIRIDPSSETGWYDTNTSAKLEYNDPDGNKVTLSLPSSPRVYWVRPSYNYTVEYYLDTFNSPVYERISDSAEFTTKVGDEDFDPTVDTAVNKTYKLPKGYEYNSMNPYVITIGENENNNIIKVLYTRKNNLSYSVEHYYEENDNNYQIKDSNTDYFNNQTYGTIIDTYTPKAERGYVFNHHENVPLTITDDKDNKICVYYNKRTDLSYKVKYLEQGTNTNLAAIKTVGDQKYGSVVKEDALDITGYTLVSPEEQSLTIDVNVDDEGNIIDGVNEIIFFYTKKQDYNYTIRYVDKDTNKEIATAKEVSNVTYMASVNESAIDIDGYTKVSPTSTTLVIDEYNKEYTFYYEKRKDLGYTVEYREYGTETELADPKTVDNQTFGDTASENAIPIDGYNVHGESTKTVKITTGENKIVFYYDKRNDLSYTVNYKEVDTETVLHDPLTEGGQTFGDKVDVEAINITGYNIHGKAADTIEITSNNENNQTTFWYEKKIDYNYTVKYMEKGTTNEIAAAKVVNNKPYLFETTENAIDIDGFTKENPTSQSVVLDDYNKVYIFYYTRKTDYGYSVQYLEKDTNNPVAPDKVVTDKPYESTFTEHAISVDGYNVYGATEQDITLDRNGKVLIFFYEKKNDLGYTVEYREYGTETELADPKTVDNQTFGDTVEENAIDIDGYYVHGESTKTVKITTGENKIVFYYDKRNDLSYTVNYKEVDTETVLHDPLTEGGQTFGDKVDVEAINITGYNIHGKAADTIEITSNNDNNQTTFWYEKKTDYNYTIRYVDKDTNKEIATAKEVSNVTYMTSVNESAIDIDGYYKVDPTSTTLVIDEYNKEYTFYYEKRKDLGYTVEYREYGTDTELANPKTVNNQTFGDTASENAIDIDGYYVHGESTKTVEITTGENKIVFYYDKRNDLSYTVEYREYGTETELADPKTVNNQTFGDTVSENAIDIDGYYVHGESTKSVEITTGENKIVFYYDKRNDLSYTVNYKEVDTEVVLHDPLTEGGQTFGDTVDVEAINITGYNIHGKAADTIEITSNNANNQTTFWYEKKTDYNYTIRYVDKDTNKEIATAKEVGGVTYMSEVNESAIDIDGYYKVDPTSTTLVIDEYNKEYTFYYEKRKDLGYTVEYREYGTDTELADPKTVDNQTFGDTASENAINIDGYYVHGESTKSVEITTGENKIVFYYDKRNDLGYVVKYLEEETDKELSDTKEVTDQTYMDEVVEEAIEIPGYELVSEEKQTFSITTEEQEIVFYYRKRSDLEYIVKYLEKGTNKELHDSKLVGNMTFEDEVTEKAIEIAGYKLVSDENVTIKIDVENNEIIFYYEKEPEPEYVEIPKTGVNSNNISVYFLMVVTFILGMFGIKLRTRNN